MSETTPARSASTRESALLDEPAARAYFAYYLDLLVTLRSHVNADEPKALEEGALMVTKYVAAYGDWEDLRRLVNAWDMKLAELPGGQKPQCQVHQQKNPDDDPNFAEEPRPCCCAAAAPCGGAAASSADNPSR